MRNLYLLFAVSLILIYIGLSPGAVAGMGYTGEEMRTGNQLLAVVTGNGGKVEMSRNGLLPLFLDLPFLAAGRALFTRVDAGQDLLLAFEPCILTALTVTLIFIWIHAVTGHVAYSFLMACLAAFCSLLLPYAFIGLETKQSFFLLAAAFLAVVFPHPLGWVATVAFALCAGLAVGSKSTGSFLLPAVMFLIVVYALRVRGDGRVRPLSAIARIAVIVFLPAALFLLNAYWRSQYWAHLGGSMAFIRQWLVTDWIWPALNVAAFFGSANKGLWVFSPLCLLGCYALPRAWNQHRRLVVFTLLTLGGLAGGFSLLRNWSDETWGPRYLHSTVGPLIIVLGVVWFRQRIVARMVLTLAAALGLVAAGLGALVPYTYLPIAAIQSGQNTLEGYQGDVALNHLRFNARVLDIWLHPSHNAEWSSARQWFYEKAPDAPAPKIVDLHTFAAPQPFLLRAWREPKSGPVGKLWFADLACLLGGSMLLLLAGWLTLRVSSSPSAG